MDEMEAVAAETPELSGAALARTDAALAARRAPDGADIAALRQRFAALLATFAPNGGTDPTVAS
jgi:beta-N-acetylhexosaminidase